MRLEYFEMIDAIEAIDLDAGTIRVASQLPTESPIFEGHFPGHPILPGVLMLEMMGHAAGIVVYERNHRERFVFLGAIRRARFRRFVPPGARLAVEARITQDNSGFSIAESRLVVEDAVAADAEIVLIVGDFPTSEVRQALLERSRRVVDPLLSSS